MERSCRSCALADRLNEKAPNVVRRSRSAKRFAQFGSVSAHYLKARTWSVFRCFRRIRTNATAEGKTHEGRPALDWEANVRDSGLEFLPIEYLFATISRSLKEKRAGVTVHR